MFFFHYRLLMILQVWSRFHVLRDQLEHRRVRVEHLPHALHLRRRRSPRQAAHLRLPQPRRTEEVPSGHAATDGNLHRRQHIYTARSSLPFLTFDRNDISTICTLMTSLTFDLSHRIGNNSVGP